MAIPETILNQHSPEIQPVLEKEVQSVDAYRVMVVAGEASSDLHAAALIGALRSKLPKVSVFGMGGNRLQAAGMELIVDSEISASVMGFTEVFGSLKGILRSYQTLLDAAKKRKPDLIILVDFPDFNLRLAKALHRQGRKIVYFISPQLWAWRKGRVNTIRRCVTKVIAIFPFEEAFYHAHGVAAEFVGHPFLDLGDLKLDRHEFLRSVGLDPARPVVALLPGSRHAEVSRLLIPMLDGLKRLQLVRKDLQGLIPIPQTVDRNFIESVIKAYQDVALVSGSTRECLSVSKVAVVTSGTATIEAALAGVPFVTVYKLSPVSHAVGRLLVRGVKHFSMANIIAGEKIVPELLQTQVTAENIANELEGFLGNPELYTKVQQNLAKVEKALAFQQRGMSGSKITATERAANIVQHLLEEERR